MHTRAMPCLAVQAYYLNRSQPPVLAAIIEALQSAAAAAALLTQAWLARAASALERELKFWASPQRCVAIIGVDGQEHLLSRYFADTAEPRPESFKCATLLVVTVSAVSQTTPLSSLHKQFVNEPSFCWRLSCTAAVRPVVSSR